MIRNFSLAFILVHTSAAFAGSCENNFSKSGNIFKGSVFSSFVEVSEVSVPDAMAQMRGIALNDKLDVIAEDLAAGNMLVESRATDWTRAVPMIVEASSAGAAAKVTLTIKPEKGVIAKAETMKTTICGYLAKLQGGEAAKAAAAQGLAAEDKVGDTLREVYTFSRDIANEAKLNALMVNARHKGRSYSLKGKIDHIQEDGEDYNVSFYVPEYNSSDLSKLVRDAEFRVGVACLFKSNQLTWVLTMRPGQSVTFKGSFYRYDDTKKMVWLENCGQVR
jgi:hypothetical protein